MRRTAGLKPFFAVGAVLAAAPCRAQVCAQSTVVCDCGVSVPCAGLTADAVSAECANACAQHAPSSGAAPDDGERQRQLQQQQEERERQARERRERLARKRADEAAELRKGQETFDQEKRSALGELKLDDPPSAKNTRILGTKAPDAAETGLTGFRAGAAPVFRTAAGRLQCAASIARAEFRVAADSNLNLRDAQKIRFYAQQSGNALDGKPVLGGCDAADSPLQFHKSLSGYKQTEVQIQDMIVRQAEKKVRAVEARPKLQQRARAAGEKVEELEKRRDELKTAPDAQETDKEALRFALEKAQAARREAERALEQAQAAEAEADAVLGKLQEAEEKIVKEPQKADELFDQMFPEEGAGKPKTPPSQ